MLSYRTKGSTFTFLSSFSVQLGWNSRPKCVETWECIVNYKSISYQDSRQYLLSIIDFINPRCKVSGTPIGCEKLPSRKQNTCIVSALEEFSLSWQSSQENSGIQYSNGNISQKQEVEVQMNKKERQGYIPRHSDLNIEDRVWQSIQTLEILFDYSQAECPSRERVCEERDGFSINGIFICSHRFPKLRMLARNNSLVTEFILAGLTDHPKLQQPLFYLFLMIYIITVVGNLGLIMLIGLNSHLHTPMYYFLFNLSFIDLCYSSVFTPKMLMNFVSRKNIISYVNCMTQLFFFLFLVISECYMLTSMAYDRYVAICNPLLYKVTMSHQVCSVLSFAAYVVGFAGASAHTGCMLRLTFCNVNIINFYLCDILPLLQLSCSSTYVNEIVVLIVVSINITVPSVTILISYIFILTAILRIKSTQGRSKAFSTCSSHIITISLFFGSAALTYFKSSSPGSMDWGKLPLFSILTWCPCSIPGSTV